MCFHYLINSYKSMAEAKDQTVLEKEGEENATGANTCECGDDKDGQCSGQCSSEEKEEGGCCGGGCCGA